MLLQTTRFGNLEVAENDIYTFEHGLPGFEEHQRFVMVEPNPEVPFAFLQSADEPALAFIVTDPFLFHSSYEFELSEAQQEELSIEDDADVAIRCIVSVRDELKNATANLGAPLVLNVRAKKGKQIILHELNYPTKFPLFSKEQQG